MEWSFSLLISCFTIFISALRVRVHFRLKLTRRRLPPGPPGWPVIGNILELGPLPHQILARLAKKYGPVMSLRLGLINTIVVSSAEAAKEMFKNHDVAFAGRIVPDALTVHSYNQASMGFNQCGPYWRMLRRLSRTELFVHRRVKETANVRIKCIDDMIRWITDEAQEKGVVELAHFLSLMSFNLLGNLVFSSNMLDPQSKEENEFLQAIPRVLTLCGQPNVVDMFPFLRWFDLQGIRKKMKRELGCTLDIISGYVKKRIQDHTSKQGNEKKDFMDVLLGFRGNGKDEPDKFSEKELSILIMELFGASTDNITSTIEWAMAELLRHPTSMIKVKAELSRVIGRDRKVEDDDIEDLKYLQAVMKETLRLHPTDPLLVPRKVTQDVKFMGYSILKDMQVFVNVWALGRDPIYWDDPLSFKPERFLSSDVDLDYWGNHFQFIPFGAGRRICPGLPLAHPLVHLSLASLLHSFDWTLEIGVTPDAMDMKEDLLFSLRKAIPLKAVPKLYMK